jgi:hypothetical protein
MMRGTSTVPSQMVVEMAVAGQPHVLGNDDRDTAEQAATFLLGEGWGLGEEDALQGDDCLMFPNVIPKGHENCPRRVLRGPFYLVAGTGFEPATSGL